MDILIIGGTGFVGSALVPALKRAGHRITLLNRGTRPVEGTARIVADRNDAEAMRRASQRFDAVIDTSAYTRIQSELAYRSFGHAETKWVHLSSAAVYRETTGRLPREDDAIGGAAIWGQYGEDKSGADRFLLHHANGPVAILRPPYLYGSGNDNDREQFIWSRVLSGRPIIVSGNGAAQLQFLHVEDLARLMLHCLHQDITGVINAAEPTLITSLEWVRLLAAIAGREPDIRFGGVVAPDMAPRSYFPFRDYVCAVDTVKLGDMGWKCRFGLRDGFAQTFGSYDVSALPQLSSATKGEDEILAKFRAE